MASLKLQHETFIDEELQSQVVDLLYAVNFDQRPGYLYLLTEHQSTADYWMPFRLLKYIVSIMDHHIKTKGGKELPIVYPIVLYANEKPYDQPTDLLSLFGKNKELAKEILWQPFHLIDLTLYPEEKLKIIGNIFLQLFLRTLKNIWNPDLIAFLKDIHPELVQLEKEEGAGYVEIVIKYLLNGRENKNPEEFFRVLNKGFTAKTEGKFMTLEEQLIQIAKDKAKEEMLSMAEKWKRQGERKGELKGKMKGKMEALRTIAINLLKEGMPKEKVMLITNLPRSEIENLK